MRALFLLHGAPGSGKTRLIRLLGLTSLTIGYDQFRSMFSAPFPAADGDNSLRLRPEAEKNVISATHAALESRMAAGTTIFFDSTASRIKDQTKLARLAHTYGYATYLIDVQGDTPLDVLLKRNRNRGIERVDEDVLGDIHARCAEKTFSPALTEVISGANTTELIHNYDEVITGINVVPTVTARRVVVVGDVHSCAAALHEAVTDLDEPGTHWVFAGDLFDRGPDPVGVWTIVHELMDQHRASVVCGNHELNLRAINTGTAGTGRFPDTRDTRDALLGAGIMAAEQTAFVDSTIPALRVRVGDGPEWLVTHGGVGTDTRARLEIDGLLRVSEVECVYGLGDRAHTYRAKSSYNVGDMPLAGYQLHGHRNSAAGQPAVQPVRFTPDGRPVVCLETGASTGGAIRAAVLNRDPDPEIHEYDDRVDPATAAHNRLRPWDRRRTMSESQRIDDLLERMRASEQVKVRPVEDHENLVACNFTRKAFVDGAWDELTMHARGLFIDTERHSIAARGYEKFFHIGEAPGRDLDGWLNPDITAWPVIARKKWNGYLALVASIDGELTVFSKSGVTAYSRFADRLLTGQIGADGRQALAGMLERTGTTAVFEVISAHDTHPIAETGPDRLVLLDAIRNTVEFSTDDKIRDGIAKRFGLECAATVGTADDPVELRALLEQAGRRPDEGVVLIDAADYRSKVKADEYTERKRARTALERVWRGRADHLPQRYARLEERLVAAGIWDRLRNGYTITGVDGTARLDLARVFDDLERIEGSWAVVA
jgi:predicted kinase